MKNVILIGAGGHSKVVINILKQKEEISIIGLIDKDNNNLGDEVLEIPIIGTDNDLFNIFKTGQADSALIAIGSTGDNSLRAQLYEQVNELGFDFINAFHSKSIIAKQINLGLGTVVMANSVINPGVKIGVNNIINTGSIIEHDVEIGNHVHVGPGVTLSGGVVIGDYSHVGTGATVIENINIGQNCLIGAGAVVIEDVPSNSVVVGNPGKIIRKRGDSYD